MHALLYLIVSLLAVALVFFTLGAPFVAALEVIIYAGAIMVLFVFVIMMLNLGRRSGASRRARWLQPARSGSARRSWRWSCWRSWSTCCCRRRERRWPAPAQSGRRQVGVALFGPYLLGVELASMLLLAGLVGAYHLGRRARRRDDRAERRQP